eukprot:m.182394 g.182394  ORF g.182394 m.182394 type:complete len:136 (+) comp16640_c3_seq4:3164-3571(+)
MADGEWQYACDLSLLPEYKGMKVRIKERDVVVFRDGKTAIALDARCYHAGGPLHMGDIEDVAGEKCVRCPWHHYKFSINSGNCMGIGRMTTPMGQKQRKHQTKVEGDRVYVKLNLEGSFASDQYYTPQMERLFSM